MDLVAKLRMFSDGMRPCGLGGPGLSLSWTNHESLSNAAAEIERLRAALSEWRCDECMGGETVYGECEVCGGTGKHPKAIKALAVEQKTDGK